MIALIQVFKKLHLLGNCAELPVGNADELHWLSCTRPARREPAAKHGLIPNQSTLQGSCLSTSKLFCIKLALEEPFQTRFARGFLPTEIFRGSVDPPPSGNGLGGFACAKAFHPAHAALELIGKKNDRERAGRALPSWPRNWEEGTRRRSCAAGNEFCHRSSLCPRSRTDNSITRLVCGALYMRESLPFPSHIIRRVQYSPLVRGGPEGSNSSQRGTGRGPSSCSQPSVCSAKKPMVLKPSRANLFSG